MPAATAFRTELLDLLFNNSNIAGVGDATGLQGSGTAGSLYISLHTADPNSGNQTTSEVAYTSYARVAVARTAGGWTVSGNTFTNTAGITFPTATGGSATATHFGIGTDASGTGLLLVTGALSASLPISSGVTPAILAGNLDGSVT